MAEVFCMMEDCKYWNKNPSTRYSHKNGRKCHGCLYKKIVISPITDIDGNIEQVAGRDNMAHCLYYEPKEEKVCQE